MAKHKRHNYKLVNKFCAELAEAHRQFHRLCTRWEVLQERRRSILEEAAEALTASDYRYVNGYSRALWDASWNVLVWKLGHEDIAQAKNSRTSSEQGGWDYKAGTPTYGGHFHASGELATDWMPFK